MPLQVWQCDGGRSRGNKADFVRSESSNMALSAITKKAATMIARVPHQTYRRRAGWPVKKTSRQHAAGTGSSDIVRFLLHLAQSSDGSGKNDTQ
jgi:hypothetical protein